MANRLQNETSPYLLQHRNNPVDWYPWGDEALDEAARSGRPVFLSIGYSACHWCHVMERESFENEKTARFLNENFVNIKVDREERPDLDSIYMDAVQAMTGHGGWPMSVFLTPEGKPFYGGTYYPPEDRHGMPSFLTVLAGVLDAWKNRPEEVVRQSNALLQHVQRGLSLDTQGGSLNASLPDAAIGKFQENFDGVYGGFGSAPKFPQPMNLDFLMRYLARTRDENARDMITLSLEKMAAGGIYDQIGGGFHRYSVDTWWLVPHFEKMLYDNALLARLYLHAYLVTGNPEFRRITEQTLDYVLREMTDTAGGFYSSQDADSEGEEGTFFLWTPAEIRAALPDRDDAELLISFYEMTDAGNFEGRNILNRPKPLAYHAKSRGVTEEKLLAELDRARGLLYEARRKRVAPDRDDKVIASWNGLMLAAFAEAGRYLEREDYRAAAVANAQFLASEIIENGRYHHTWKDGRARFHGYLEDYAYCGEGFLALYAATFDEKWFALAREAADGILAHFSDEANGGFFDTADDHETLVTRPKAIQDNAVPSGNAMALGLLARLASYTGEAAYREPVHRALAGMEPLLAQYPNAFGHWLGVLEYVLGDPREIAVVVPKGAADAAEAVSILNEGYRPGEVVALKQEDASTIVPLLEGRGSVSGRTTVHVCRSFTCQLPVTGAAEIRSALAPPPAR